MTTPVRQYRPALYGASPVCETNDRSSQNATPAPSKPRDQSSAIEQTHTARVRLEISGEKLYQLLESGHLCAAEIRGLDRASKQRIWRYCLRACSRCLHRLCVPDPSDA